MSLHTDAIRDAHEKGYRVRNGIPYNPQGKPLKPCNRVYKGYETVRFNYRPSASAVGKRTTVRIGVAKMKAYEIYGEAALEQGVHVRHLNGDSTDNRIENLALGTASENMMDRCETDRIAHATMASRCKVDYRGEVFWERIRQAYASGFNYNQLARRFHVAKSTISYHLSKDLDRLRNPQQPPLPPFNQSNEI